MSNFILMYLSGKGDLFLMFIPKSDDINNVDDALNFVNNELKYRTYILKETFLNYEQYRRDQIFIYEEMMNDFYSIYDLPSN